MLAIDGSNSSESVLYWYGNGDTKADKVEYTLSDNGIYLQDYVMFRIKADITLQLEYSAKKGKVEGKFILLQAKE